MVFIRTTSTAPSMRRGFTLVELLIILAVMAIIAGMLLPAVNMVKEAAKKTSCASNLRQIGMARQVYEGEEKGQLLPHRIMDGSPKAPGWNLPPIDQPIYLRWWSYFGIDVAPSDATHTNGVGNTRYDRLAVSHCPAAAEEVSRARLTTAQGFRTYSGNGNFPWTLSGGGVMSLAVQRMDRPASAAFAFCQNGRWSQNGATWYTSNAMPLFIHGKRTVADMGNYNILSGQVNALFLDGRVQGMAYFNCDGCTGAIPVETMVPVGTPTPNNYSAVNPFWAGKSGTTRQF